MIIDKSLFKNDRFSHYREKIASSWRSLTELQSIRDRITRDEKLTEDQREDLLEIVNRRIKDLVDSVIAGD